MDIFELITNYFARKSDFQNSDNENSINLKADDPKLNYVTGDTIPSRRPREYLVPEVINANSQKWGYRNRNNREPINSEAAPVTTFENFVPKTKIQDTSGSFIGITKNGKMKVGSYDNFDETDFITRSYKNTIGDFIGKDNVGKYDLSGRKLIYNQDSSIISSPSIKQPKYNFPLIEVIDDKGNKKVGSLNLFVPNSGKTDTYGATTGGRYIIKDGDNLTVVSGSVDNLKNQINQIRSRSGGKPIDLYTLDNGTYNQGLRTYDKKMTSEDLKRYDNLNSGGGNFLYIKQEDQPKHVTKDEKKKQLSINSKEFDVLGKFNFKSMLPLSQESKKPFSLVIKDPDERVVEETVSKKAKEEVKEKTPQVKNTFSQAFSEARKNGKDIFEWNGKKYTTQMKSKKEESRPQAKVLEKLLPGKTILQPIAPKKPELNFKI